MEIIWDDEKGASNLRKHGISFAEASSALLDPYGQTLVDSITVAEERFLTIACSKLGKIILVIWSEPKENIIRIISARKATKAERWIYEERV